MVAASVEGLDDARKIQADFPLLAVQLDEARGLLEVTLKSCATRM